MHMSGLNEAVLSRMVQLILQRKKPQKVVIYGSRARGDFKRASDVDIAIFGGQWTDRDISLLKADLEEQVNTPLKFDVLRFEDLSKASLKEKILKEGLVIYDSRKNT